MFEGLVDKLNNAFGKFKNKGKLSEADVKAGMREVKLALLEADVNFKVVKDFIKNVSDRAVGAEVMESPCTTGHQDRPRGIDQTDGNHAGKAEYLPHPAHRNYDGRSAGRR